jgi:hypothetical protein
MTTGNGIYKMKYALSMIVNINHIGGGRYTPTGRTYSMAKRLQKEAIIDYWTEDKRKAHAELVRKKQKPRSQEGNASMIQYQKTKTWTEKALLNRTNIVKKSAEARTGVPLSPDHKAKIAAAAHMRKLKFIDENILSIELAFDLEKNKVNRNQISKLTGLSWDRVDWILSSNRNIITEHLKPINRV